MQPIVAQCSDACRSKWGRRRPFVVAGAAGVIISLNLLAWIEGIVYWISQGLFLDIEEGPSLQLQQLVQILSIALVILVCVFIQPLQMGIRVLIVESFPSNQQSKASAWASYFISGGNILATICGALPQADSQYRPMSWRFRGLSLMASLALATTVSIGCLHVEDSRYEQRRSFLPDGRLGSAVGLKQMLRTYRDLSPIVWKVCQIQFMSWVAWFPILYYATT